MSISPVVSHRPASDIAGEAALELLLLRVGGERFALPLAAVDEAVEFEAVELMDDAMPGGQVLGVLPLRGALLPVFRPDAVLHAAVQGSTPLVVILRGGDDRIGLQVDDVDDVIVVAHDAARPSPIVAALRERTPVVGVIRHDAGIVTLLDAAAIVASCSAGVLEAAR